jgi:toxin-antitoxin system PIN domain toxin
LIALDTNILVQAHQRESVLHQQATEAVRKLAEGPVPWGVCFHSLVEFYAVVTHPRVWRKPSTPEQALDQIAAWRESPTLRVFYDNQAVIDRMATLCREGQIQGAQVHDARIAASCLVAGVKTLWTIDRDFSRFPALRVENPLIFAG